MTVSKTIKYIGVNDKDIDLFESQYSVPNGISYNSYVILDERIAVMDTVDSGFTEEWLTSLKRTLFGRVPDYLIIQHMEPDHSANIINFLKFYPEATVVASAKAFTMMKNFFGTDFSDHRMVVGDGDRLALGEHTLTFYTAPMVHWPEVIVTYDALDKVLFSADGFGKFGIPEADEPWADEARRYYIGIVGKYGAQVTDLLKKASALDIETICPLHGPILKENISYYIDLYTKWASYTPEEDGTVIAYTSVYGNTEKAVLFLKARLSKISEDNIAVFDLSRCDMSEAVSHAFKYPRLVLATTTYNGDIFPPMREFLDHLTERGFKNRRIALIENGSWAPLAAKVMRKKLEEAKGLEFTETTVTIDSALNNSSLKKLEALACELCENKK